MQLISFIASVMTLCSFIRKSCVCTCWKKWRPFYILFSRSPTIIDEKVFSLKMDAFQENLPGAPEFLLTLMALFGHQPSYKTLRGSTASQKYRCKPKLRTKRTRLNQTCEICYILTNQEMFRKYIIFLYWMSLLPGEQWLRGPDKMDSRTGFSPRAIVWRPLV